MTRKLLIPVVVLISSSLAYGRGLLIPVEPDIPPLAMLNHHVNVSLEDQVAVTKVEQTFRNHTSRNLEATYVFPVPAGASVREFAMYVNGQRVKGELLKADKAKKIYTDIVRQTKEPALLEYIGTDMLTMKIFPVPANGEQKVEVSFTAIAKKEHDLVEYVYPLKTDRTAASTLEEFHLTLAIKSQRPLGNIYSPSHAVSIQQPNNYEAVVRFEQQQAQLDRDFQLFYTNGGQDIGLTAIEHRPISDEEGYVMLLVSPRAELSKNQKVPRDIVFVVDTSGSMMHDKKLDHVKAAMRHCLEGLSADDRFGLINFATTVNSYRDKLVPVNDEQLKRAKGWVADLYAGGGTAIHEAISTALEMRSDDPDRMFTVVFFTDGQPTIGETDTDKILADLTKHTSNTRIFSFGVGNDLNAVFLDQIAEKTRALSAYSRPEDNLELKVAGFFDKINKPVLANLKLTTTGDVRLTEVYPPRLPDLFHGDQLVVLARYQGSGHAAVILDGQVGNFDKKYVFETNFLPQADGKPFVEELWARRKVGYLLDQIRVNGERKELVDEVVQLATNYGITTPYTSYLIMPDAPIQIASAGRLTRRDAPAALAPGAGFGGGAGDGKQSALEDFARRVQAEKGQLGQNRGRFQDREFDKLDGRWANATPAAKDAYRKLEEASPSPSSCRCR